MTEPTYSSVFNYFEAEHPDLLDCLGNPGKFWPQVAANTITEGKLLSHIRLSNITAAYRMPNTSRVYCASVAIRDGRQNGKIRDPEAN